MIRPTSSPRIASPSIAPRAWRDALGFKPDTEALQREVAKQLKIDDPTSIQVLSTKNSGQYIWPIGFDAVVKLPNGRLADVSGSYSPPVANTTHEKDPLAVNSIAMRPPAKPPPAWTQSEKIQAAVAEKLGLAAASDVEVMKVSATDDPTTGAKKFEAEVKLADGRKATVKGRFSDNGWFVVDDVELCKCNKPSRKESLDKVQRAIADRLGIKDPSSIKVISSEFGDPDPKTGWGEFKAEVVLPNGWHMEATGRYVPPESNPTQGKDPVELERLYPLGDKPEPKDPPPPPPVKKPKPPKDTSWPGIFRRFGEWLKKLFGF